MSLYISAGASDATLEQVLIFATGASEIPPVGFHPSPEVRFWDDVRPRSNTCANVLYLPLKSEDYEDFKAFMDHAILNSPTFGFA